MNKMSRYIKALAIVLLLVGLLLYVVFAMVTMTQPDAEEVCEDVELIVDNDTRVGFVNNKQIEDMLKRNKLYPKGQLLKDVDTRKIEELVSKNEFVESVECYKTASGKLCVEVKQRNPVIYVIPDGQDGYYVDKGGNIIPSSVYTYNMVVATGAISKKYASEVLSDFGTFLLSDGFWNKQIEQIYVRHGKGQESVVELIPRVGDHVVYMGSLDEYRKKLRRLRIFYDKAMGTVGWNKYSRINLEFNNQIVCEKRK